MSASLILALLWMSLSSAAVATAEAHQRGKQVGLASWYGSECSRTATGERYNPASITAAHRTLPFGTLVEVHNLDNGKSVTVRINNRGPFRKGRIIDLSKGAAQQLQMLGSGTAKVELVVVK
jgi:rare lipoprotein A